MRFKNAELWNGGDGIKIFGTQYKKEGKLGLLKNSRN